MIVAYKRELLSSGFRIAFLAVFLGWGGIPHGGFAVTFLFPLLLLHLLGTCSHALHECLFARLAWLGALSQLRFRHAVGEPCLSDREDVLCRPVESER